MSVKRRWLRVLNASLNRLTRRLAASGHGPFSLIVHTGRTSGTVYRTPVILARTAEGFVAELTYGADVDWYRNIVAAGGCEVVHAGRRYRVDRIERMDAVAGRRAFGRARGALLRMLRRHEFRALHVAEAPEADPK